MLTTSVADKVLRTVYLDVVSEQINQRTSPFYNMIMKGSEDICGKEVISPCRFGINGGIGCKGEDDDLPASSPTNFIQFKAPLINIFGNVEVSDKVLRASQGTGGFINVLNNELDSLLNAAKYNFGRMLFQDGSGTLANVGSGTSTTSLVSVTSVKHLIEGMVVDFVSGSSVVSSGHKITLVDRVNKTIKITPSTSSVMSANTIITLQGSFNNELWGLPYVFSSTITTFYSNARSTLSYTLPDSFTQNSLTCDGLQTVLDSVEEKSGSVPNLLLFSYDMRRRYLSHLQTNRTNMDYMYLDGGFKAMSYNGIPIHTDQFVEDNTAYFINTEDFKLEQLGDWSWIEGDNGRILRQLDNKAAYGATLVKYANLICTRPLAQSKLTISVGE